MHRLRCFGRLAVEDEGGERVQLRSRKHLALLLYLAAHPDRRHDRERVARLFWDTDLSLARHSLSQALYDLGRHLPDLELDRTNREVGLERESLVYEGLAFEEAVREDRLGEAVRTYEGPFAPDIETVGGADFERWVERERTRYRNLAEKALLRRVTECADAGRWGEMVVAGNRLVDMNPLNEAAHRSVMRGLWLQGDRSAALAHFEEHEDFLLRELPDGFDGETLALIEKIRGSERPGGGGSVRERPRPEMVGREEEFRILKDTLSDVLEGESRFVVVRGEAGIGKTRLLEEFAEVAALEDVRLLESRCYAAESDVPYGPIVDGLREVAHEAAESSGGDDRTYYQLGHLFPEAFGEPERGDWDEIGKRTARRRLAEEVKKLLEDQASDRTTVWLIEDLHWADSTSLWMLSYLARRTETTPLLLIGTSRRRIAEFEADGAGKQPWRQLHLDRLSTGEIERLVSGMDHVGSSNRSRVASLADGNPFYAQELAKSGLTSLSDRELRDTQRFKEELPAAISGILETTIAAVTDAESQILAIVAVAQGHASPNLVIDATDLSSAKLAEAADDLQERGLVRSSQGRLTYSHDILRQFVYHSLSPLSRTVRHRQVADWLRENREGVDPGTLALHYHEADEPEKAYTLAVDAARNAIARYANQEAISLGELALECATTDEEEKKARCLLGEAQYREGNLQEALEMLEDLDDKQEYRTVIGDRSVQLLKADAAIELPATETVKAAVKALDYEDGTSIMDYLWGKHLLMKAAIRSNDPSLASETVNDISQVAIDESDISCRALAWMIRAAYQAFYGDISNCRDYITFVQEHAGKLPYHLQCSVRLLSNMVSIRLGLSDVTARQARLALSLASERHDRVATLTALSNLLASQLEVGAWKDAEATIAEIQSRQDTHEESGDLSNLKVLLAVNQTDFLFYTEKFQRADEHYGRVLSRFSPTGEESLHTELLASYGLNAAAIGDTATLTKAWRAIKARHVDDESNVTGVQDRYKLYWLLAFMAWRQDQADPTRELRVQAKKEEKVDKPGAVRMRWIARLLEEEDTSYGVKSTTVSLTEMKEFRQLQQYNMGWFAYYSRRWFQRASSFVGAARNTAQ